MMDEAQKAGINFHIATQMNLKPGRIDNVVLIGNGLAPFDLYGTTPLHLGQRNWAFADWAKRKGFGDDADPLAVAVATGYAE